MKQKQKELRGVETVGEQRRGDKEGDEKSWIKRRKKWTTTRWRRAEYGTEEGKRGKEEEEEEERRKVKSKEKNRAEIRENRWAQMHVDCRPFPSPIFHGCNLPSAPPAPPSSCGDWLREPRCHGNWTPHSISSEGKTESLTSPLSPPNQRHVSSTRAADEAHGKWHSRTEEWCGTAICCGCYVAVLCLSQRPSNLVKKGCLLLGLFCFFVTCPTVANKKLKKCREGLWVFFAQKIDTGGSFD